MTIEIPPGYERLDTVDMRSRRPARASDWARLIKYANRHFARCGHHFGGIVYPVPFETTSEAYTSTPSNGVRPLDTWTPGGRLERTVAGDQVVITTIAACLYAHGRLRLYNDATSTLLATIEFTNAASSTTVVVASESVPVANTLDSGGGPAPLSARLDLASTVPVERTAQLYTAHVWEGVIDQVALLPTG